MSDIVVPSGWGERLEGLVGSKRQTMAIAGVVGVAMLIALAALGGRAPARVAPPAIAEPATTPAPVASEETGLLVHVSGAVHTPGLYRLPDGARVADAVDLAGGPTGKADLDALNLAEHLTDASKVHVPERGETPAQPTVAGGSETGAPPVIDINTADATALETIPGIGPTKAAAIVAHREEVGPFTSVDQLLEVQGIGPATLEALRAYVTV